MKVTNKIVVWHWEDIGFVALPEGWINVWKVDDGTYITEPCPGVLIQECTSTTNFWDEEDEGRVRRCSRYFEMERETRTVFAYCEDGVATLDAVDNSGSYVVTTTKEQWAAREQRVAIND